MNYNLVVIGGRLTDDPEEAVTDSGTSLVNFTIATNRYYKNKQGEREDKAEYVDVVFYGKLSETIGKYFSKGDPILVDGRLETRSWEHEGKTHYRTHVVGKNFTFVNSKNETETRETKQEEDAF